MYISFIRRGLSKDSAESENLFSIQDSSLFGISSGFSFLRYIPNGRVLSKAPKRYDPPFKLHLKHTHYIYLSGIEHLSNYCPSFGHVFLIRTAFIVAILNAS